ncbi:RNA polymerase sigma factor RpoH [Neisseriaceae bacterium PsAf]|nr:RNA polymerase sigma factor RpoH [Neisseriaceae bacterium PsAf]
MSNEITLPVLTGHGSLAQYINTVNSIPLLTAEEEHDLAEKLANEGDLEAAKRLILSHLRLVVSIARDYDGYGLNQADLIQEGNIGLMKAVKKFDPNRGVRLVSFAIHWIKAEIHEFVLRNWRLVRVATTKPQRKLFFNLRSMKKNMNALSEIEAKEIAEDLGVKLKDVYEMEQRMTGHDIALIRDSDDEDSFAPIDWLADYDNEPEIQLGKKDDQILQTESLTHALTQLDDRSRDIVESRWLADNNSTLHDLAVKYGVSPERIRQIESKAIEKMRGYLIEDKS